MGVGAGWEGEVLGVARYSQGAGREDPGPHPRPTDLGR